jgi:hypothetical protein
MSGRYGLIVLVLAFSVSCTTQRMAERPFEFERAPLSGMIYDTESNPIPAAELSVDGRAVVTSDAYGRFLIPDLERGRHTVTARLERFEPIELEFEFLNKTHILYLRMYSFDALIDEAEDAIEDRDWAEARKLLDRAEPVGTGTDTVIVSFLRAVIAYRLGEYREAEAILKNILDSGYEAPAVHLFLADLYVIGLNDPTSAGMHLERYRRLRGEMPAPDLPRFTPSAN